MASKKKEAKDKENGIPEAPGDYDDVGVAGGIQTWYRPEVGDIVHGRLMGRHEKRTGRKQAFYQIKLLEPQKGIQGKGDDAEVVELKKGDVLNVNETKQLEDLHPLAADDGVYNVHITVLEKIELESGNSFWRMRVKKKTLKQPTFTPDTTIKKGPDKSEYDDIPF